MEIKTITETSRTFEVVLDDKGKEKKACITQRKEADWGIHYEDLTDIEQSVGDFLIDTINVYMSTGNVLKAPIEVAYTTNEFRHWICPHCGKQNTTEKVEQGYPLPKCHFCKEQHDWGSQGD
ncbi:unnamed protein product [marine sediment metagenome]|uniref:Uncharacterized protein n=1 Tax=marine sediment metagenome TaxID=412755 RepID=X1DWH9_9ZZZZ